MGILANLSLLLPFLQVCCGVGSHFNKKQYFPLLSPLVVEEQLLWVSNVTAEVNTFRIPLITFTPKGSLLAFCEARKFSYNDMEAKFFAVKRSVDKGSTWSPMSFILDDGPQVDGLNLGVVVVDEKAQSVILVYTVCFHQYKCITSSVMMVESLDDGLSWSRPRNLSEQLGVKSFAPGPGLGIQKRLPPHQDRLVVCGHGTLKGDGVFCILSDDSGKTWRNGAALKSIPYNQPKQALDFNPDECQPVELSDGSILVNVRNQNQYHCHCRMVVRSLDGGETLPVEELFFDKNLIDPAVAAGMLEKEGRVYFTNPAHPEKRVNFTLRWSLTNGKSWEKDMLQLWPGPSGYSCMTTLNSSTEDRKFIFILYERGKRDSVETVVFAKVHLYGGL
ncbi:unnamed protein product [Gadus morhua 'NCC']